ncbi:hypothetical protein [Sporomusa sphaeroides]|uniref:hypothetical protein n=1 Tax=Sporomusa sphaeroides TaxID=47679 RepID=UPI00202FB57C|nr:hypothetical protein [Sporomusa sphaeroides]MCM0757414.1 hypothetical protein [Sporomusa sphaeroides DSM 2875]HML33808.1 hypothetical protein [Sporomusa sphaeroides]
MIMVQKSPVSVPRIVRFIVGSREYTLTGSKAEIGQQIKGIVLNIKKAASTKKADTKINHCNYTIVKPVSTSDFEERKSHLRRMLLGYRCSAAMEWDKLPADGILCLVDQYRQRARLCRNAFYLGVALYGLHVARRREVAA